MGRDAAPKGMKVHVGPGFQCRRALARHAGDALQAWTFDRADRSPSIRPGRKLKHKPGSRRGFLRQSTLQLCRQGSDDA